MLRRTVLAVTAAAICGLLILPMVAQDKKESKKKKKKAPAATEQTEKGAKSAEKAEKSQRSEKSEKSGKDEKKWAPAVKPKPLSENVKRGLGWLSEQQLESGAWGQGEESKNMGGGTKMKAIPSVADTCAAALALVRSGSTPKKGPYAKQIAKGVNYVCSEIEKSDEDSMFITATRGTRVQSKLGPFIDTFMASMLLSEVKDEMPDVAGLERASKALNKILAKMEKNQRKDGTWDDRGWAAALAQGMAVKGMNRAKQGGARVSQPMLAKAQVNAQKAFDKSSGKFSAKGSAGVELYSTGANVSALADSVNTNSQSEDKLRQTAAKPGPGQAKAVTEIKRIEVAKADLEDAQTAMIKRLDDKNFIAGFGSNGGEEFLSYMAIGESLVVKGGEKWKSWDKSISQNLNRIQNKDGSWSGHHCITGRTFCTSASLLVLMVDRAPVPVSAKMKKQR